MINGIHKFSPRFNLCSSQVKKNVSKAFTSQVTAYYGPEISICSPVYFLLYIYCQLKEMSSDQDNPSGQLLPHLLSPVFHSDMDQLPCLNHVDVNFVTNFH